VARWFVRIALMLIAVLGTGGVALGAASAETAATDLLVTCLSCGEHWLFAPSATFHAGLMALLTRRHRPNDTCPKCGSRAVSFSHVEHRLKP
jgi:hypothetical protein